MAKLRDIMRPRFLTSVGPDASAAEAVRKMAEANVGMVAVLEGDQLVGLFSERDLLKRVVFNGLVPSETPVSEVMTTRIITADVDEDSRSAVEKMDHSNIRHLPVMETGRLVAMISIRDLLRLELTDRTEEVRYLQEYLFQPSAEAALAE